MKQRVQNLPLVREIQGQVVKWAQALFIIDNNDILEVKLMYK